LWRDKRGFIATTDLILLTTVLVLGTLVGAATLRDQVVQEFGDLATALGRLNQSYSYQGDGDEDDDCWVAGSSYEDQTDFGEDADEAGKAPAGISVDVGPSDEGTRPEPNP